MNITLNSNMHVYFIGIGGISMSGLASILLNDGFKVSGSDAKESDLTRKLSEEGATVYYGQETPHITDDVDLIVYTAAIRPDNAEYKAMMESGKAHMTRAEFLGQLMKGYDVPVAISGTHGKTTTTSMISEILIEAETDPTLSVGGVLKSINSNIRVGSHDYFVFEACEYTNSFLSFFPKISVILNIEEDHLDFFKDINDIRSSFKRFANLLPEDGLLVINGEIDNYREIVKDIKCPYVTYGFSPAFDFWASDISFDKNGHPSFTCHVKKTGGEFDVSLATTGIHNVSNALAAIAVARHLKVSASNIKSALLKCSGSKRRFEELGSFNGVTVVDDYAHHPTEIRATLNAALQKPHNKLWVVFQPHTYTRTKALLPDFVDALSLADKVVLCDVYAAREKDIYGCNSQTLYEAMKERGIDVTYIKDFSEIEKFVKKNCTTDDLLITMGAGDVVNIGQNLVS
ncbi:MAG: UDP-N-acetylmuramate--L-alanine ligase [Lachnospiraceae bacterium]|nr:UDP-N-acetylmuramate--L-alanine ligase [Lachnospiraceae bacterium]